MANDLEAAPSPERPPARCLDLPLYPPGSPPGAFLGSRRHHPTPAALIQVPSFKRNGSHHLVWSSVTLSVRWTPIVRQPEPSS